MTTYKKVIILDNKGTTHIINKVFRNKLTDADAGIFVNVPTAAKRYAHVVTRGDSWWFERKSTLIHKRINDASTSEANTALSKQGQAENNLAELPNSSTVHLHLPSMFSSAVLWDAISQPFMRAQSGLFHGKMKQYGNNVPFSKHKTRRTWLPNIQHKRIRSDILEEDIKLKVTTRALKTIKTKGGLDNYLTVTPANLLGDAGMRLRMRVRAKALEKSGRPEPEYQVQPVKPTISGRNIQRMLAHAQETRRFAAEELGEEGFASAEQTIAHIDNLRRSRRLSLRVV